MEHGAKTMRLRLDAYTRFCLGAIVVLMTVMIVGLWAEKPQPSQSIAVERYQPRSALEIADMVREQQQTNVKLDKIIELLQGGNAKVQLVDGPVKAVGGVKNAQPETQGNEGTTTIIQPGVHAN